jgi:acyl-coenzyme A thioesterase PaaI-like protein
MKIQSYPQPPVNRAHRRIGICCRRTANKIEDKELATGKANWNATAAALMDYGWRQESVNGFLELVGPIWAKEDSEGISLGFIAEDKHKNRRGVVQGGMLATLADRSLGRAARFENPEQRQATVQIDLHFIDAVQIGEFVQARGKVQRRTRSLIFVAGALEVDTRIVASSMAIFKLLRPLGT